MLEIASDLVMQSSVELERVCSSLLLLEIHARSNPLPLTESMQLYFRNYMKYFDRLLS